MNGKRLNEKQFFRFFLTVGLLHVGQVLAGIEDGPRHTVHLDWMSPGLVDLEADLQRVEDERKSGVMVLFTTQGCTYCAAFVRLSLGDPDILKRVQDEFVAVELEIFDDAEMTDPSGKDLPIKQFAEQHQASMAPTLLFFGPDRKLIFRAIGYQSPQRFRHILDYLADDHYTTITFRDYLINNQAISVSANKPSAPLRDDPLFTGPPYTLSRIRFAATKPLLVIFETPDCAPCDAFHTDVLGLDEVRQLLRRFEVVRLDASDASTPVLGPDDQPTTPTQWFVREGFTRVPALLYVNETGQVVFKTDALIERQRMLNASGLVLDRAYEKGWSYQRYARSKAIERQRKSPHQE